MAEKLTLYAEGDGNDLRHYEQFDEARGIKIEIFMLDGEAFVRLPGIKDDLVVCEGLPLTLTVYKAPHSSAYKNP